jgi:hypothetical protein
VKKSQIAFNLFISLSMLSASALAVKAYAAETYYIEVGKPSSVEEVHEEWSRLTAKYKSLLGKLNFYPKASINQQGETTNTIQAGPIREKARAQKICNRLFSNNTPCFVIEGIEKKPPTMSIRVSQAATQSGDNVFPWHVNDAPPEQQVPVPPRAKGKRAEAKVDVAEAIAVPLSNYPDNAMMDNRPAPEPEIIQDSQPRASLVRNFSQQEFSSMESGALVINGFSGEEQANSFWNYVNTEFPDMVNGLRVRIQRPLLASNKSAAQIKIYPFASGAAAQAFCGQAVNGFGIALECHYEASNAQQASSAANNNSSVNAGFEDRESAHASAYEQRRQYQRRRVPAGNARVLNVPRHESAIEIQELPEQGKTYWAQVAIAESKGEATHRWNDIKKKNAAALKNVNSKLATSSSAYAKYSMRLGPFDNENNANELCDKLQARGVDCLVVSGQ